MKKINLKMFLLYGALLVGLAYLTTELMPLFFGNKGAIMTLILGFWFVTQVLDELFDGKVIFEG